MKKIKNNINWHWLAGFWEGEGSCGHYVYFDKKQNKIKPRLAVSLAQKQKKPLLKVKEFIGYGSIYKMKNGVYVMSFKSSQARGFLEKLLPYCHNYYKIR